MSSRPHEVFWKGLLLEKASADIEGEAWVYRLPEDRFGIITPVHGTCSIEGEIDGERRRAVLIPGKTCLVAPDRIVRVASIPPKRLPFSVACIQIPLPILRRALAVRPAPPIEDLSELHMSRALDPHIAAMASTLLQARGSGAREQYAVAAAHYLAEYLLHPSRASSHRAGGLTSEQLSAVRSYMEANLSEKITIDQLAAQAGLSRYYFVRRFSDTTGKTPMQLLTELRLESARYLLVAGSESIGKVGRLSGFPSPEHFARVFRKRVGCSPTEYRRREARR
ncbi:helix-turn-helix transcriptional regulator [Streptomyces sp. NPDC049916]|uniref:helix-turn-helix transcriptional regulator n=1 Tax=Streptomyces sp. NPDC049916 TaxID=3155156 RepID=UPI003436896A